MVLSRRSYWVNVMISSVGLGVAAFLVTLITMTSESLAMIGLALLIIGFIVVACMQCYWMIGRFHDVGLSALWILATFIPFIGGFAVLIITLLPANQFDYWRK